FARLELAPSFQDVFSRLAFYEAGLVAIVVVFSVVRDLALAPARIVAKLRGEEVDTSRRRFMERATNVGVLSISAMIAGTGAVAAFRAPEVVRQRVRIPGLP